MFTLAAPRKLEAALERHLGTEAVEQLHICSSGLTTPVPIMGTPACAYRGTIIPRDERALRDMAASMIRRQDVFRRIRGERGGFASLAELISEATIGGKLQRLTYRKTSTVAAVAAADSQSLWNVGAVPVAGSNAAAAPGGTSYDNTTTGGIPWRDPIAGETAHLTNWNGAANTIAALLLYDRIIAWSVAESTASNAITGTQTRYNGAAGTDSYPAGAFVASRVTTIRVADTNTVTMTYKDQDNNAAEANTAVAMVSAAAVGRPATNPLTQWTLSLNAPDTGVREVTNITYSATGTGVIEWEHGYPLALLPLYVANVMTLLDGINSGFNLVRLQTDACLALWEVHKQVSATSTYIGNLQVVSG